MLRLVTIAIALAATSAHAQSVGRPPPRGEFPTAAPQNQIGRLQVQPAQSRVSPRSLQTADGPPPPPQLSPAARALAVQQLTDGQAPPNLGQTVHLSVNAPIGADGADFSYNGARIVAPKANLAIFDSSEPDASLTMTSPNWPAGLKLFDCAVTGVTTFDWTVGFGPQTSGGQAPVTGEGRLIFVATTTPGQLVTISSSGNGVWYLRWCDITRIGN